jgi:hypothetical protein
LLLVDGVDVGAIHVGVEGVRLAQFLVGIRAMCNCLILSSGSLAAQMLRVDLGGFCIGLSLQSLRLLLLCGECGVAGLLSDISRTPAVRLASSASTKNHTQNNQHYNDNNNDDNQGNRSLHSHTFLLSLDPSGREPVADGENTPPCTVGMCQIGLQRLPIRAGWV